MRYILLLTTCLALAACSGGPGNDTLSADDNAIVNVDAIDSAKDQGVETPQTVTPPAPGTPGGLENDTTPISEGAFTPESAQGAANVVQTYYALLEGKKYGEAWALWRDGGKASGLTREAFTASFAKYSEYHAQIGAPGQIEGAAGSRFVTVPVVLYGRVKEGQEYSVKGSVTLQRSEVDGAGPEQRKWHISDSAPKPQRQLVEDNRSTARYRCMDGSRLVANYDPDNGKVTVLRAGKRLATMTQQRAASGIAYSGEGHGLTAKGNAMTFTAPNLPPIACTVIR